MAKDYAVKVSVRNGRILRRMREMGYETQTELAEAFGMDQRQLNSLITMRIKAYNASGQWRKIALDLSAALKCQPEDLFNEQQRQIALERNSAEVFMDTEQVQQIMAGDMENATWAKIEVNRLLDALPNERMRKVMRARMEGYTLEEIAADWRVGRERIRQIEAKAERMMKYRIYQSDKSHYQKLNLGRNNDARY